MPDDLWSHLGIVPIARVNNLVCSLLRLLDFARCGPRRAFPLLWFPLAAVIHVELGGDRVTGATLAPFGPCSVQFARHRVKLLFESRLSAVGSRNERPSVIRLICDCQCLSAGRIKWRLSGPTRASVAVSQGGFVNDRTPVCEFRVAHRRFQGGLQNKTDKRLRKQRPSRKHQRERAHERSTR